MKKDLTGQKFGRWTVLSFDKIDSHRTRWNCICECGNKRSVIRSSLILKKSTSCGCYGAERRLIGIKTKKVTHGKTVGGNQPIYRVWSNMMTRCYNKKSTKYNYYGGRGIVVCDKWHIFQNFLDDMGDVKNGMTIDRIDVNGNYCKENCRWVSKKEQANNRRSNRKFIVNGKVMTLAQISESFNINYGTLWSRINRGLSIEKSLKIHEG